MTRGGRPRVWGIDDAVADYILIPILLAVMSIALVALIYWGGFVEERRNRV